MGQTYKTIDAGAVGEIVEKKSRFISYVEPVTTEVEALTFIEKIKKKHYDARHNCFAFSVGIDMPLLRFSDDGEPQGTAGKPILEVITGAEITNVIIVVTRYFGGTLLGTGGLVRAYTDSARDGLGRCRIVTKQQMMETALICDYTDLGKLQYLFASENIPIKDIQYAEQVELTVQIPVDRLDNADKLVTEATAARVKLVRKGDLFWA
ncbi:MAG: YigZ family protein [Lachnospiraceae bacterium]|nr:YigZ family protein [Lachnospiraceae bacterium]